MAGLSVIIPFFDNAATLRAEIPHLIAYLEGLDVQWQIVLSDDGSRDPEPGQKLSRELGCQLVRGERNEGKGSAVRRGMLAARGKVRIFTDSDIPFELDAIGKMFELLARGEADLATGERRESRGGIYFSRLSGRRQLGNYLFARLTSALVPEAGPDTQVGLKAFTDQAAETLFRSSRINRYAFDVEVLCLATQLGYRIARTPVALRGMEHSQISLLRDGSQMFFDLLRIALTLRF